MQMYNSKARRISLASKTESLNCNSKSKLRFNNLWPTGGKRDNDEMRNVGDGEDAGDEDVDDEYDGDDEDRAVDCKDCSSSKTC